MAGKLRTRRAQIALKTEVIEGVEEALIAANAVLCHNPTYSPDIESIPREPSRRSFTPLTNIVGKRKATMAYGLEVKGTGSVIVAPEWDIPLQACGFQRRTVQSINIGAITNGPFTPGETITGGTSLGTGLVVGRVANGATKIYYVVLTGVLQNAEVLTGSSSAATATTSGAPVAAQGFLWTRLSTGEISLTQAMFLDGLKFPISGSRGNVNIQLQNGGLGLFNFDFTGKFITPTDVAMLAAITYEDEIPPAVLNVGLFLHNTAPVGFTQFNYANGGVVSDRENAGDPTGYTSFLLTQHAPMISIDPELTLVADHDWYGKVLSGVASHFHAEVGAGAGSKVIIAAPKCQYTKPAMQDRNSVATLGLDLVLSGVSVNTEDDEIQIAMV